jgi:hypothetical protein
MEENMSHGSFSWNELTTSDTQAALEFYTKLFGWKTEVMHMGCMDYTIIKVGERGVGGVMTTPEGAPVKWTGYVTVDNVDETVKLAVSLGATVCVPLTDIPEVGRFAVLRDPQGAGIAVISYLKR